MLAVLALCVEPPPDNKSIFWVLMASHAFSLTLVVLNMLKPTQSCYMALQCLNIVAMFLQNVVIIYAVQIFLDFDEIFEELTQE